MVGRILHGDARQMLAGLEAGSVQCCVTSPPYWQLRSYLPDSDPLKAYEMGSEPTPEAFVANLVDVMRGVWRVLRDDGTCWLNMGDSYASTSTYNAPQTSHTVNGWKQAGEGPNAYSAGIPPKNLCLIPERLALALQADGWIVRSVITWVKTAPMPEAVLDRPTSATERIFLLAKRGNYYFDAEAVREKALQPEGEPTLTAQHKADAGGFTTNGTGKSTLGTNQGATTRNLRNAWILGPEPYSGAHFATFPSEIPRRAILAGTSEHGACGYCGAPWRRADNWTPTCMCNQEGIDYEADDLEVIATPTGERAGDDPTLTTGRKGFNRPRGEGEGQRPITRYEQRQYADQLRASPARPHMEVEAGPAFAHYLRTDRSGARPIPPALLACWIARGWLTRVNIPAFTPFPIVPCVVLDPFAGSGTSLMVAEQLGRSWIGIELSEKNIRLIEQRTAQRGFASIEAAGS